MKGREFDRSAGVLGLVTGELVVGELDMSEINTSGRRSGGLGRRTRDLAPDLILARRLGRPTIGCRGRTNSFTIANVTLNQVEGCLRSLGRIESHAGTRRSHLVPLTTDDKFVITIELEPYPEKRLMTDAAQNQLPQPGQQHELLKPFEGTFRATVRIFRGDDDPMESMGTMSSSFVLGGLYLEQEYQGDPVEGPISAFCGKGFWGYNFYSQKYEGFWIDNVSSMMQREDGEVDETGKIWEMHSEIVLPQGSMKKRSVIKLVDENHHEVEAFLAFGDAPEAKSMELFYSRDPS